MAFAADKNPMRGLASKIFCQLAVIVMITSQTIGASVTQIHRNLPIFNKNRCRHDQRHRREQLIRNPEKRPQAN